MADPTKLRLRGLDGLRGVCALTVVLLHSELLFNAGAIFCHGYLAVDVFFMLSGFVIAASYDARLADDLTAWAFLKARVARLAPVYWAGTALCIAATLVRSHYDPTIAPAHVLVLGALAMLLIPQLAPGSFAWPINFVAWTLLWELIVNFAYARWLRRVSTRVLLGIAVVGLALATEVALTRARGWSFGMGSDDLWLGGLRALPEFLIGVVLYRQYQSGRFARLPLASPLVLLSAWLAIAALPPGLSPLVDLGIVAVAAPLLIALLVRGEAQAASWFAPLGAVSYPLYAAHLSVIGLAQHTPLLGLDRGPRPLLAVVTVLLALGVAWAIHLLCDPAGRRRHDRAPGLRISRRYRAS